MQYAPTLTDQKFDSLLSIESKTRYVWGYMPLWPIHPRRENLKICMDARETCRGLEEYGHICAKPAEDLMNMDIFTQNPPRIGWIWSFSRKTRQGLDRYGHFHAKPAGDWTDMAIFTQNPPRIRWIWPYLRKTRRGFDEYGHIHAKPAEDWTDMTISTQNPPGMGRIWPYLCKTRRESDEYGHSYRILAGVRIKYVSSFVLFGEDRKVCAKIFLKLGKNRKVGGQIRPNRGKKKKVWACIFLLLDKKSKPSVWWLGKRTYVCRRI